MAEHIFERLARERGITVEEMRAIISTRIEKGWNDPNPEKRVQWRSCLLYTSLMERGGMFRHMVELQRESSNWQVGGNRGGS